MKPQPHHGRYHEIDLWKRAASRINPTGGEEEQRVRKQLESYIHTLTVDLEARPEDDSAKVVDIVELEQKVPFASSSSPGMLMMIEYGG